MKVVSAGTSRKRCAWQVEQCPKDAGPTAEKDWVAFGDEAIQKYFAEKPLDVDPSKELVLYTETTRRHLGR